MNKFLLIATIITSVFSGYKILSSTTLTTLLALMVIFIYMDRLKFSKVQVVFMVGFLGYAILAFVSVGEYYVVQNLRYWFGSILFILLFKVIPPPKIDIYRYILRIGCYIYILEALLINTYISSENIHYLTSDLGHIFFGFYERPVGFTSNPGTTSVFLIVLSFLIEVIEKRRASISDMFLVITAVVLSVSTTAVLMLFIYFIFRFVAFSTGGFITATVKTLAASIIILFSLFSLLSFGDKIENNQKYSLEYVNKIVLLKYDTIKDKTDLSFFGSQVDSGVAQTSGDFGLFILIVVMGGIGFIIYFLMLSSFWNADYRFLLPLLLLLIGSLHYPSAFSPAGHVLMALIIYGEGKIKVKLG